MKPADLTSLRDERQQLILDQLARDGRVLAVDLSRRFGISEDTIRRDLRELRSAGLCRRVYGGALPLSQSGGTLAQRQGEEPARKAALGEAAAALIRAVLPSGGVLFLDAGSTNLAVAHALPADLDITVVTNAPGIAAALIAMSGIELVMIGGRIDVRSGAALGVRALRDLNHMRVDLALLGTCAIDAGAGLAAFSLEEAELKRAVAEVAASTATAVTSDKLGTVAPFGVMAASLLTHLVAEAEAPELALASLRTLGVQVHRAASAEVRS